MRRSPLVLFIICAAFGSAGLASAADVKLDCVTEKRWVRPGVPDIFVGTFDDQLPRASLFITEFGGLLNGENVLIDTSAVSFKFKARDGAEGSAFINRADGVTSITLKRAPEVELMATCRRRPGKT